jgi:pyrroline-5-carboxylate reductase
VTLSVVGGGNMGAALVAGIIAEGAVSADAIVVVEASEERRAALADLLPGVTVSADIVAAESAVIAVKPPGVADVAKAVAAAGVDRVVSIAAGVTTATIRAAIREAADGRPVDVARAMPNTPAMVGRGVTAICADADSDPGVLDWAERLLGAVGIVERIDESLFDAVTAVTGSGPAYVFAFAEALIEAARSVGLPADRVPDMVSELLLGSATLLAERGDAAALRVAVTSPGGTTAAGLGEFERLGLDAVIAAAIEAARDRGRELGAG